MIDVTDDCTDLAEGTQADLCIEAKPTTLGTLPVGSLVALYQGGTRGRALMLAINRKVGGMVACSNPEYPGVVVWLHYSLPVTVGVLLA